MLFFFFFFTWTRITLVALCGITLCHNDFSLSLWPFAFGLTPLTLLLLSLMNNGLMCVSLHAYMAQNYPGPVRTCRTSLM